MEKDTLSQNLEKEFQEYKSQIKEPHILLIGGTGVGKSSLINKIFSSNIAQQGTGIPITQEINKYTQENIPVVLYDTKGYEIGSGKEEVFLDNVAKYVTEVKDSRIDIVWYCIQATSHRITDFDIKTIKQLREYGVPLAVVLTKAELVSVKDIIKLKDTLKEELHRGLAIFEVSTVDQSENWELEKLCQWSLDRLPKAAKRGFIAAQKHSLKLKRQECESIIKQHTTGSLAVVVTPIPGSDAPMLIANQVGMISRIMYIYGLEDILPSGAIASGIIGSAIARAGIMTAASLLKFIPGAGTLAAAMINASVASTFTYAIGYAGIELCERIYHAALHEEQDALDTVLNSASEILKNAFNQNSKK